jgi:outer membrane protein assembly factor BamA
LYGLILSAFLASAQAETPADWVGLPLAGVQLEAPEGGLPEESLDPLMRAIQGQPLDLGTIRLDLATLFRVGNFRSVEAHAEPWVTWNAIGEAEDAVLLTYRVFPAPRIGKIKVSGNKTFSDREIRGFSSLTVGQGTWFNELEAPRVKARIENELGREGWVRATVTVQDQVLDDGELVVHLIVDEGVPNVLETIGFTGDLDALSKRSEGMLRRWARKAGLREGQPFAPTDITRAQNEMRLQLALMQPGPFRRQRGWIDAQVNPVLMRNVTGTARVTFTIEPGKRLELDVTGLGARGQRGLQGALGIDERLRLTRGFVDEAPDRVRAWLAEQGYHVAQVEIALDDANDDMRILRVQVQRGPRYTLPPGGYPAFLGIDFWDNEAVSDADLQRVVDEASLEVIRRDYYSEAELNRGLIACRELYRARGYLSADLTLEHLETQPKGWLIVRFLASPFRALAKKQTPVRATPQVRVVEGPQTTLASVTLVGGDPLVDLGALYTQLENMEGAPYSSQHLETITTHAVQAHRDAGFLEVDAWVDSHNLPDRQVEARLVLEPGPQVLLRSKVTRGLRRSRSTFVRREAELELGSPITTAALEDIRNNLYELGIFRSVKVEMLGDGTHRDLVIDVSERPRWAYEWGFGLSTDQGLRSFTRVTRRNVWGVAHRIDLVGQVGLQYRSDSNWRPDFDDPDWRLTLTYTAPRFPTRSQDLILDGLLRERRLERTWRMDRSGAGITLESHPGKTATLRTGVRLETRQLRDVNAGALLEGEPWLALDADQKWRVQEQVAVRYLQDRRDDPVLPSRGWLAGATGELAPGLPWDQWRGQPVTSFAKVEARMTTWLPLGGFSLKLAGSGGVASSLNHGVIPLEDRFRLGGTSSLRGFRRDAVGPRNLSPRIAVDWPDSLRPLVEYANRDNPEIWVPTGGDVTALGTAELLLPLTSVGLTSWEGYSAAFFADAGNVWLHSPDTQATSQQEPLTPAIRWAIGTGMRAATPVGPLQIDIAANLQSIWATGEQQTLLVQGYEEPPWRAHLTLGSQF